MKSAVVLFAGVGSTLVMTAFSEAIALVFRKPFHVVTILAIMLPFKKNSESPGTLMYSIATVVHYFIGVIFAFAYSLQLSERLIINDWLSAFLYGGIIASVAVISWRIFFWIHPNPPPIELKNYLLTIWGGHIILSLTMAGIFRLFPLS